MPRAAGTLGKTLVEAKLAGLPWHTAGCHSCHLRHLGSQKQDEGRAGTPATAAVPSGVPIGHSPRKPILAVQHPFRPPVC